MTKHTPEPWYCAYAEDGPDLMIITTSDRDATTPFPTVAIAEIECGFDDPVGLEQRLNSERIVACVNACTGIPTPALKEGVVIRLVQVIRDLHEHLPQDPEIDAMIAAALANFKEEG